MRCLHVDQVAAAAATEPPSAAEHVAAVSGPSSMVALPRSLGTGEETIMPSEVKTMFLDVGGVKHAIETDTVCNVCHHLVNVVLRVNTVMCSEFAITCSNCTQEPSHASRTVRGIDGVISKFTQWNLATVNTTITNGSRYEGCVSLCNDLALPDFVKQLYNRHTKFLYTNMKLLVEESRMRVIQPLKEKFHNTTDSNEPSAAFLDISVSFDGT